MKFLTHPASDMTTGLSSFLSDRSAPLLDVRSPSEFAAGHIPGAQSFPLFSDQERALVGTCYKKQGRKAAVKKGLALVGPKMADFVAEAEQITEGENLRLYCWRGGMRSGSMAWLLRQYGFTVEVLEGGYKTYRRGLLSFFEQDLPLLILTGYTGSGKTVLLQALRQHGAQVVDLEALANHQGSSFGNQKSDGQPTTEQFQNLVFEAFRRLDLGRPIWIEDESLSIGKVNLPDPLFQQMKDKPRVLLEVPREQRIRYLVQDYGSVPTEKLAAATEAIQKRLGDEKTKQALEALQRHDLSTAADAILHYYDRQYRKAIRHRAIFRKYELTGQETFDDLALRILRDMPNPYS